MASPGFGLYVEAFGGLKKERIERECGSVRGREVLRVDQHQGCHASDLRVSGST